MYEYGEDSALVDHVSPFLAEGLAAHTVPEPTTHSAISIAEDVGVFSLAALTMTHPLIALPIILLLMIGVFFLLHMAFKSLGRAARRVVR